MQIVSSIAIQQSWFNISYLLAHIVCFIWPIDRSLSGATTPGQSKPERNSNEGVLHIPQISKAGVSPLDGLMLYSGHLLGGSHSAEMQLVYSTAPADWAEKPIYKIDCISCISVGIRHNESIRSV